MSYSTLYLGKELNDLSYSDIENYFVDEKDESNKIEYKSYHNPEEKNHTEKENGVIRAICGLLNSEGGLVIWGAPVGQAVTGKKEKIFKGALSPVDKLVEKDSFINRVTDLITPSPKGIIFQRLENGGKYLYVIEVEQSSYSPHQYRNVYYMRIDGQTKPAPHHYIEALFRKVTFPKLEGYIRIDNVRTDGSQYILTLSYFIFNKSKLQNEHTIYSRLIISLGKFANYGISNSTYRFYRLAGKEMTIPEAKATLYYNEPIYETETILFSPNELTQSNFECDILLHFGGKQSPLMVSKYKMSLRNIYAENPNSLIVSMEENLYSFENSDKIDKSEQDKLKLILKR